MNAEVTHLQGGTRTGSPSEYTLELKHVSKRFGVIQANDRVDFRVKPGEIRGLVGENGAGKSTLAAIASGLYKPDSGEIAVNGKTMEFGGRADAIERGINMVHQQFMLVDDCTVAQNVVLGQPGGLVLKTKELERGVSDLGERYGIPVDPEVRVSSLTPTERQRVEILAALWLGRTALILDEPTSVLAPADIEQLFKTMRRLAAEGCAVVFTSHKLREVIEVCDAISVMRHGRMVDTVDRDGVDAESLATLMVGKRLTESADSSLVGLAEAGHGPRATRPSAGTSGQTRLRVIDTETGSFDLNCPGGEILGVAGVEGNGQHVLAAALAGVGRERRYRVELDGEDITGMGARERAACGVAFVPEDAASSALVPTFPVAWNLALRIYRSPRLRKLRWFVDMDALRSRAAEAIAAFDIRGATPEIRTAALSGGNRQKIVLARELDHEPRLLVIVDPTVGLDVGAAQNVYSQIRQHRDRGAAIVLISTDLDEIEDLSDRVAVLYRGSVVGVLEASVADRRDMGMMMTGLSDGPGSESEAASDVS